MYLFIYFLFSFQKDSSYPGRPALPCPCPALFVTTDRERAPQGTGSEMQVPRFSQRISCGVARR